jgi:hypothetical protein
METERQVQQNLRAEREAKDRKIGALEQTLREFQGKCSMFEEFEKETDKNFIKMGEKVNKYWELLE